MRFEYISLFFLIFTSVLGAYTFVKYIAELFYNSSNPSPVCIYKIKNDGKELEYKLRSIKQSSKYHNVAIMPIGFSEKDMAYLKKMCDTLMINVICDNKIQEYINLCE